MSRPTMDRAIEAIDRGDVDQARALCEAMKHEWRSLHDLMVEGVAGLISFVQDRLGDDGVADAWRYGSERGWVYTVPHFESWKLFEMPLPGYLGYLPFLLECGAAESVASAPRCRAAIPRRRYCSGRECMPPRPLHP